MLTAAWKLICEMALGVVLGGGEEEFAAYVGEREGGLYGRVGARSQAFIMVISWMVGAGEGGIPGP